MKEKRKVLYSSYKRVKEKCIQLEILTEKQKILLTEKTERLDYLYKELNSLQLKYDGIQYKPNKVSYEVKTVKDYKEAQNYISSFYNPFFELSIKHNSDGTYTLIKNKK
jgi:hypothetical protein